MSAAPDRMGAPPAAVPPRHDTMRRLQIGVGGVLIILLLVAMAGLASDRARESSVGAPVVAQDVSGIGSAGNNNAPLEELGVQPVTKDGLSVSSNGLSLGENLGSNSGRGGVPDLEPDPELERARQYKP
jgi:hypothetical protein